jgi:hypothetical protein
MKENKIGYHGSKSDFKSECENKFISKSVKEQRVDGSYTSQSEVLRCTLMGFERNYQVKILSNQINKLRLYTSLIALKAKIKLTVNP